VKVVREVIMERGERGVREEREVKTERGVRE
jgi:hypothetical protein